MSGGGTGGTVWTMVGLFIMAIAFIIVGGNNDSDIAPVLVLVGIIIIIGLIAFIILRVLHII